MDQTDKSIRTLHHWVKDSRQHLESVRNGLNRNAVSLVVLLVARQWPTATEATVDFGHDHPRLVAVHDAVSTVWHIEWDGPNATSRSVDKVLTFAVEHGGFTPQNRPDWTAGGLLLSDDLWDLPILERLAFPPGSGLAKPLGLRFAADLAAEAEARD